MSELLTHYLFVSGLPALCGGLCTMFYYMMRGMLVSPKKASEIKAAIKTARHETVVLQQQNNQLLAGTEKLQRKQLDLELEVRRLKVDHEVCNEVTSQLNSAQDKLSVQCKQTAQLSSSNNELHAQCQVLQDEKQYLQNENQQLKMQLSQLESNLNHEQSCNFSLRLQLKELSETNGTLQSQLSIAQNTIQSQSKALKLNEHTAAQTISSLQGQIDSLEQSYHQQMQQTFAHTFAPLQQEIKAFKELLHLSVEQNNHQAQDMLHELHELKSLHQILQEQTISLTQALRKGGPIQGLWGELTLERLLDFAGLIKGIHYCSQVLRVDACGRQRRIDVELKLPNHKSILIDSKCALNAFADLVLLTEDFPQDNLNSWPRRCFSAVNPNRYAHKATNSENTLYPQKSLNPPTNNSLNNVELPLTIVNSSPLKDLSCDQATVYKAPAPQASALAGNLAIQSNSDSSYSINSISTSPINAGNTCSINSGNTYSISSISTSSINSGNTTPINYEGMLATTDSIHCVNKSTAYLPVSANQSSQQLQTSLSTNSKYDVSQSSYCHFGQSIEAQPKACTLSTFPVQDEQSKTTEPLSYLKTTPKIQFASSTISCSDLISTQAYDSSHVSKLNILSESSELSENTPLMITPVCPTESHNTAEIEVTATTHNLPQSTLAHSTNNNLAHDKQTLQTAPNTGKASAVRSDIANAGTVIGNTPHTVNTCTTQMANVGTVSRDTSNIVNPTTANVVTPPTANTVIANESIAGIANGVTPHTVNTTTSKESNESPRLNDRSTSPTNPINRIGEEPKMGNSEPMVRDDSRYDAQTCLGSYDGSTVSYDKNTFSQGHIQKVYPGTNGSSELIWKLYKSASSSRPDDFVDASPFEIFGKKPQYLNNEERKIAIRNTIKRHIHALQKQIDELIERRYQHCNGDLSPDFVLMFVPVDYALTVALQYEPSIYERASRNNVYLVSPSSLIPTLRVVIALWLNAKQSDHLAALANAADTVCEKAQQLAKNFSEIKRAQMRLSKLINTFDQDFASGEYSLVNLLQNFAYTSTQPNSAFRSAMLDNNVTQSDTNNASSNASISSTAAPLSTIPAVLTPVNSSTPLHNSYTVSATVSTSTQLPHTATAAVSLNHSNTTSTYAPLPHSTTTSVALNNSNAVSASVPLNALHPAALANANSLYTVDAVDTANTLNPVTTINSVDSSRSADSSIPLATLTTSDPLPYSAPLTTSSPLPYSDNLAPSVTTGSAFQTTIPSKQAAKTNIVLNTQVQPTPQSQHQIKSLHQTELQPQSQAKSQPQLQHQSPVIPRNANQSSYCPHNTWEHFAQPSITTTQGCVGNVHSAHTNLVTQSKPHLAASLSSLTSPASQGANPQ